MNRNKSVYLTLIGALVLSGSLFAQVNIPDVVGTVNGEKITKVQLTEILYSWQGEFILSDYIQMKLVEQAAKKANVTVTQDEVNSKIIELKKSIPPNMDYLDFLKSRRLTSPRLAAIIKMQLQSEKVVGKDIKVTPDDLAQFLKASHILIPIKLTPETNAEDAVKLDEEAKNKINSIAEDIKSGKISFEDAAKQYSEDPGTKNNGGDLNWFTKGQMVPDFEKAALALTVGQISEPIKTDFGYHLIKLTALGSNAEPADKKMLEEMITTNKLQYALPEWFDSLRNNAKIENNLAPKPKPAAAAKPAAKPAPKPANQSKDSEMALPPPPPGK